MLVVLLFARTSVSQAVDPDTINFATISVWPSLRDCVKCQLQTCYGNIAQNEGCLNNACLCRGSTQGDAIPKLYANVLTACSNLDDATTATSVLTAYCQNKGYETIVSRTILQTGASTVTVTALATVTVTRSSSNYCSAAESGPIPNLRVVMALCSTLAAASLLPIFVMLYWHSGGHG
ncbi:hypothetical protein GQ53DRAFT_826143 [Thozetella sp. PMI_491]|nr:hypothetical protein GQ53DRAFT_826143 [Thozetella sp. PMI_491]